MGDWEYLCETNGLSVSDPDALDKMLSMWEEDCPSSSPRKKNELTIDEENEVNRYIEIFKENNFKEHYEVNNYISKYESWDRFLHIRSLNDHGEHKEIPGILPKFYAIICKRLHISGAGGKPLTKSKHY